MENRKQKDVIFEVVKDLLGNSYSPSVSCRNLVDVDMAIKQLKTKIGSGEFKIAKHFDNDKALHVYLKKLVFNWLNKDIRLNGGTSYKDIKAPKRIHWSVHRTVTQEKQPIVHEIFNDRIVKEIVKLIHQYDSQSEAQDTAVAALIEKVLETFDNRIALCIEKRINEFPDSIPGLGDRRLLEELVKHVILGWKNPFIVEHEEEIIT